MGDETQAPLAQNQTQNQSINNQITFVSSSDPELERRIFSGVHSPGRQLSRIARVVEALIAAHPALTEDPKAKQSVDDFQRMQADIEREKHRGNPRYVVEQLQDLQKKDPGTFAKVTGELRAFLNGLPPA